MFETADAVEVGYGLRGIDVTVDGEQDTRKRADGRCTAITTRGSRCKHDAKDGSTHCGLQGPTRARAHWAPR